MKTPISYYGGKLNLVNEILPMIPSHIQYVEPFIGGGAVFFAKPMSRHEVINDFDGRLINFYEVLKNDFQSLQKLIKGTLHSEYYYKKATKIIKSESGDKVLRAWAYWVCTQMSFSKKLCGGFAFANDKGLPTASKNAILNFTSEFYSRVSECEIFNRDAIKLIQDKDTPDTFFYLDPPYAESECGQYEKLKGVYYELLDLLPSIKGKWLMSSYPSDQLNILRLQNRWNYKDLSKNLSVSGGQNKGKTKTECLTWNYELKHQQVPLFSIAS